MELSKELIKKYKNADEDQKKRFKQLCERNNENKRVIIGTNILIIDMKNEPQYFGKRGKVKLIDDLGQLHGTWGGCAIIPEVDIFLIL